MAGYWTTRGDSALSLFVFESEEAAERMSEQAEAGVPDGVTLDRIEVREVVAHTGAAAG